MQGLSLLDDIWMKKVRSFYMDENRVGWENKFWLICMLRKLRVEEKDNG
jgi:hypothetical protein